MSEQQQSSQEPSNQIAGAITFPQSTNNENVGSRPRQPQNLQGLLRFAMEATKREDAPGESVLEPLDEERKRFLEEALKSLTIDVIEILLKAINILKGAGDLSIDCDITEYLNAFESILEYVDRIDTAIDFYKIGGYEIFVPCFKSVHAQISSNACNVLAELCQNNPFCQDRALELGYIKTLIDLVAANNNGEVESSDVAVKAVYALSCMIREHDSSLEEFRKQKGPEVFLQTLQNNHCNDKLRIKICFLLSSLCNKHADFQNQIVKMGFVPLFISILGEERNDVQEHVLATLSSLVRSHSGAREECQNPDYSLKSFLKSHLRMASTRGDEALEIKEYCNELLGLFNTEEITSNSVER